MILNVNFVVLEKKANFNGYIVPLLIDLKRSFLAFKRVISFFSKKTLCLRYFVIKF